MAQPAYGKQHPSIGPVPQQDHARIDEHLASFGRAETWAGLERVLAGLSSGVTPEAWVCEMVGP